jgi:RNA polymerase-binding transcription factor DksA
MNTNLITEYKNHLPSTTPSKQGSPYGQLDLLQTANATIDWPSDPIDVAQRFNEIYNCAALDAFNLEIQQKRSHAKECQLHGFGGLCEDCGKEIPLERLIASHWEATRCIHCQTKYDHIRY